MLTDLLKRIEANGGFLNESTLKELAASDRLRQCLVRCNGCRFVAAAQDVAHIIGLLESTGKEWCRDVSLPAGDPIWRDDYTTNATDELHRPMRQYNARREQEMAVRTHFNEADCGGAFDGFTVTSDADPGL
jgi:hypothetical protein